MNLRYISLTISPKTRTEGELYIGISTNVSELPQITTFETFLNYLNNVLTYHNVKEMKVITNDYVIEGDKINIKYPELIDAKTTKAEDFIYVKVVEGVGLIINMYVQDTMNLKKNVHNAQLVDYKIALNATQILKNTNQTQSIDNHLVINQLPRIGRIWVKYFDGYEPDDIMKLKLITKLFNKL